MTRKHIHLLASLAALILSVAVWSCTEIKEDEPNGNGNGKDKDNKYTTDFQKSFFDMVGCDFSRSPWIFAQTHRITIDPGPVSDARIYIPDQYEKYYLAADYSSLSGATTVYIDTPVDTRHVLVEIGDRSFIVEVDSSVSYTSSSTTSRTFDKAKEPMSWIFAFENDYNGETERYYKLSKIDCDFNDLVLKISAVHTDNDVRLTITPRACGDGQQLFLHFKGSDYDRLLIPDNADGMEDLEFHQWFGIKDYMTRVNTGPYYDDDGLEVIYNERGGWASQTSIAGRTRSCTLSVSKDFDINNLSCLMKGYNDKIIGYSGLYVTVGTYKSGESLLNTRPEAILAAEPIGAAPHVLIFPNFGSNGEWKWATETTPLNQAYGAFNIYVKNPSILDYTLWYVYYPDMNDYVYN